MNFNEYKNKLYTLIEKNDFDSLFTELKSIFSKSQQLNNIIFQSGRFSSLREAINKGIITHELKSIEENKIRQALIYLIGEMDNKYHLDKEIQQNVDELIEGKSNLLQNNVRGDLNIGGNQIMNNGISYKLVLSILLPIVIITIGLVYILTTQEKNKEKSGVDTINQIERVVFNEAKIILPSQNWTLHRLINAGSIIKIYNLNNCKNLTLNYESNAIHISDKGNSEIPIIGMNGNRYEVVIKNQSIVECPLKIIIYATKEIDDTPVIDHKNVPLH